MPNSLQFKIIIAFTAIVSAWSLSRHPETESGHYITDFQSNKQQHSEQIDSTTEPAVTPPLAFYEHDLASSSTTALVHAPSLTELPDGRLMATWFGGSREGAKDVKIFGAYYNPANQNWSDEIALLNPEKTGEDLQRYIKKLGNPVITMASNGELWLFYVSVSMGGWATSQINLVTSTDFGQSWSPAKRIITSPFLNLSTLVKGTPIHFTNGNLGLPVYHELAGKFGELLIISPEGLLIRKERLDHGRRSLQPVMFVQNEKHAVALMRNAYKDPPFHVLKSTTENSGDSWSHSKPVDIANPNSALTGLALSDKHFLAVLNDTQNSRLRLTLAESFDAGESWNILHRFEDQIYGTDKKRPFADYQQELARYLTKNLPSNEIGAINTTNYLSAEKVTKRVTHNMCNKTSTECAWQFDYPYLIKTSTGEFHLLYTWNKSLIKHIRFNQDWLDTLR
jgi:predicted neuraminidase